MQEKRTLFFVDDEPDFEILIRQLLAKEIREGKYEVLFAQTGLEAFRAIRDDKERKIDLLFTDLKMPGQTLNGFQLIEKLRLKKIPIKIIVISAFGDFENVRTSLREHNVIDFVTKSALINFNLRDIVERSLEEKDSISPESRKVRFQTLVKMVKELPSYRIRELIEKVIPSCALEDLQQMRDLSKVIEQAIDEAIQKESELVNTITPETEELIEKLKSGEIDVTKLDLEKFNSTHKNIGIYKKIIYRNGKEYGPYYHLHWFQDDNQKVFYLASRRRKQKNLN